MARRSVVLLAVVLLAVGIPVAAARPFLGFLLGGGASAGDVVPEQADRLLAAVSERWQREAAAFLLAGEATFSLGEEEASALLAERLAGVALSSWQVRRATARFQGGRVLMELGLLPPAGPLRFLLGQGGAAVRLTLVPVLAGEAVEVRLAEARVGRVMVSPTRVAELLAGTAALPPGVSLDTRRATLRVAPRDVLPGIPLAVARLTVRDGSLSMGVRAAPR